MKADGLKQRYGIYYLFLLPAVLYFLILIVYPFITGLLMSFQDYKLMGSSGFNGLDNYVKLLKDFRFIQSLKNTFFLSFWVVLLSVVIPLSIAVALNETMFHKVKVFIQTVIYLPKLISAVVIVGLFVNLLKANGTVSRFLFSFGFISEGINFISSEKLAPLIFVTILVWRDTGYLVIIYLASMLSIHPALYEAADIDGAGFLRKCRYITIPLVMPTVKLLVILTLMGTFRTFSVSFLMATPTNRDKITTAMVYSYRQGIERFDVGVSTASAILVFIIILVLSLGVKRLMRYS